MQAPYLHVAFVCESIPEDGEMSIKDLLGKINVEGDTEKMVPFTLPSLILFLVSRTF